MKIIDMHCDTIYRMFFEHQSLKNNDFNIDLNKMEQGDYLLQCFAVFTNLGKTKQPYLQAKAMIDLYQKELELNQDVIAPVFKFSDIEKNQHNHKMSALLTLEEGSVIEGDLNKLQEFYDLGVRMITLTWNYENGIGFPNVVSRKNMTFQDTLHIDDKNGLTEFGKQYVKEMERLGMIVDVSHLSDAGFYDVLDITTKPFVASHSNARNVCGVARNMSDDMIKQLSKRGGVMGINYAGDFLKQSTTGNERSYVSDMVKHIKHIVSVGGIDCVGLGSDFDGIDQNLEMNHAGKLSMLVDALYQDGFSKEDIEKICYKNVLRVLKEVLK